jgi:uncharacterized membrane-anchored protein YitT (DUF2179 family)
MSDKHETHHDLFFDKKNPVSSIKQYLWTILGVCCAAFGLEFFLVPNRLLDGGVTGISLLVDEIIERDGSLLAIFIFAFNLPFIFMGLKRVSKAFALKTFLGIVMLSIAIELIHLGHFPPITDDKLLVAVFGGFFLGAGIGFAMRGGGVIDGTEVLALYLTRIITFMQVGELILIINILIFGIAASVFGLEAAMYSILTYMAASKTVDFITQGIEEYTAVTIVSDQNEKIRKLIIKQMERGVTIYKGKRGLTGKRANEDGINDIDIIVTVITKLEMNKLRHIIDSIDPKAFLTTHAIGGVRGGMVKKRALH